MSFTSIVHIYPYEVYIPTKTIRYCLVLYTKTFIVITMKVYGKRSSNTRFSVNIKSWEREKVYLTQRTFWPYKEGLLILIYGAPWGNTTRIVLRVSIVTTSKFYRYNQRRNRITKERTKYLKLIKSIHNSLKFFYFYFLYKNSVEVRVYD